MRTYPPNGSAFTPYSVSPRIVDHRRGPNPTKNSSTLIPNHFAAPKCAASWIRIVTRMATKNRKMPNPDDTSEGAGEEADRLAPGPLIGPLQAHCRHHRRRLVRFEHGLDHLDDTWEGDATAEERGDGGLGRR